MSDGLGAGFFGLTMLVVLLGIATLLIGCLAGVVRYRRRTGTVPCVLRYVAAGGVAGVVMVAGFAVVVLYPEAATLAGLFVSTVLLPLVVVGFYLHRTTESNWVGLVSSTGMTWSLPFVIGLIVTFGLANVVTSMFDLAPVEARALGLYWIVSAVGGLVVVSGAILVGKRISLQNQ